MAKVRPVHVVDDSEEQRQIACDIFNHLGYAAAAVISELNNLYTPVIYGVG